MSSQYTNDARMRNGVNRAVGIRSANGVGPTDHPRSELRDTLAAMLASVFKIRRPGIEDQPIQVVPPLPFPCAEIEFLQTGIGLDRAPCFG